ncbi:hypothetical protein AB0E96_39830, partial [Kitasatospora sp. NPDC036755]
LGAEAELGPVGVLAVANGEDTRAAVRAFADAAEHALRTTTDARPDTPTRPMHLRPAAEYWL